MVCLTANRLLCARIAYLVTGPWLIVHVNDLAYVLRLVQTEPLAALIIDVDDDDILPMIALCERVRACRELPLVALVNPTIDAAVNQLLAAGASDYIAKPISDADLQCRLRMTLHQRLPDTPIPRVEYGALMIDFDQHHVRRNGQPVALTRTEWRLLRILVKGSGRWHSNDELLRQLWGKSDTPNSNGVRVYVQRLRQKLEPDPQQPRYILNATGFGYRFPTRDELQ